MSGESQGITPVCQFATIATKGSFCPKDLTPFNQYDCWKVVNLKTSDSHFLYRNGETLKKVKGLKQLNRLLQKANKSHVSKNQKAMDYYKLEKGYFWNSVMKITKGQFTEFVHTNKNWQDTLRACTAFAIGLLAIGQRYSLPNRGAQLVSHLAPTNFRDFAGIGGPLIGVGALVSTLPAMVNAASLNSSFVAGPEFLINNYTLGDQISPSVAPLGGGNFVATWSSEGQDGSGSGVYAQRFDVFGNKLETEFQVNNDTASNQINPKVAKLRDGCFVIIWNNNSDIFSRISNGVYGQIFGPSGEKLGGQFRVNPQNEYVVSDGFVTSLRDGGFVVFWSTQSGPFLYGQLFFESGQKMGRKYRVSRHANTNGVGGVVTLKSGGFANAWVISGGIKVQVYDANGRALSNPLQVSIERAADPIIASLENGDFLLTWRRGEPNSYDSQLHAQRFTPSGIRSGSELSVTTQPMRYLFNGGITPLKNGGFIVIYSLTEPVGQEFDAAGNKVGEPFSVDSRSASSLPLDNGNFLFVYSKNQQDEFVGDPYIRDYGVFARIYSSSLPIPTTVAMTTTALSIPTTPAMTTTALPAVEEFTLTPSNIPLQSNSNVVPLESGGFAMIWLREGLSGRGLYGQIFNDSGQPVGSEFLVSIYTYSTTDIPQIKTAALENGQFVVAWSVKNQDNANFDVFGQRFNSLGEKIGDAFHVNDLTSATVTSPSVTGVANGFFVTWIRNREVHGQLFDLEGNRVGMQPSIPYAQDSKNPTAAAFEDGRFVVVWEGYGQESSSSSRYYGHGIQAQIFDAQGVQMGFRFLVNTNIVGEQRNPGIAILSNGNFIIAWTDFHTDKVVGQFFSSQGQRIGAAFPLHDTSSGFRIDSLDSGGFVAIEEKRHYDTVSIELILQEFDASGNKVNAPVVVFTYSSSTSIINTHLQAGISLLKNGKALVSWAKPTQNSGAPYEITLEGKILPLTTPSTSATTTALPPVLWPGAEFQINTHMSDKQFSSFITPMENGNFVVVWKSENQEGTSSKGISGQLFNSSGSQIGSEFQISSYNIDQYYSGFSIAPLQDGGFMAFWSSSGTIYGQVLNASGQKRGPELVIYTSINSPYQGDPSSIALPNKNLIVTWSNSRGIFVQQLNAEGQKVGAAFQADVTTPGTLSINKYPYATPLQDGGFFLFWNYKISSGGPSSYGDDKIFAQRYSASVQPIESAIRVDSYESFDVGGQNSLIKTLGHIATLENGNVVAIWSSSQSLYSHFGQIIEPSGQKVGSEFAINTVPVGAGYGLSSVTPTKDGGFLVVWESGYQNGGGWGVYGQRFDRTGKKIGVEFVNDGGSEPWVATLQDGSFVITVSKADQDSRGIFGQIFFPPETKKPTATTTTTTTTTTEPPPSVTNNEFMVNSYTQDTQMNPSVAVLENGFIVVWESDDQDGDRDGVYAQRFNKSGQKIGPEFLVNTYTTSSQSDPRTTALEDGGFLVVWESRNQDGDGRGVYGQRFDALGLKAGEEFLINTHTQSYQTSPSAVALKNGTFVVTWESFEQDGSDSGAYGQIFNAAGQKVGIEFRLNTYVQSYQGRPNVAALPTGGFVATWSSIGQDGSDAGVYAQVFNSSGQKLGGEFLVNSETQLSQTAPRAATISKSSFVVSWLSSEQDGSSSGIYAQIFNSSGGKIGGEFLVNTSIEGSQTNHNIASLESGGFVVTWEDRARDGIYAQRFNSSGQKIGGEFLVNQITSALDPRRPNLASSKNDELIFVWDGQDGDHRGILARIFPPTSQIAVTTQAPIHATQSALVTTEYASPTTTKSIKVSPSATNTLEVATTTQNAPTTTPSQTTPSNLSSTKANVVTHEVTEAFAVTSNEGDIPSTTQTSPGDRIMTSSMNGTAVAAGIGVTIAAIGLSAVAGVLAFCFSRFRKKDPQMSPEAGKATGKELTTTGKKAEISQESINLASEGDGSENQSKTTKSEAQTTSKTTVRSHHSSQGSSRRRRKKKT